MAELRYNPLLDDWVMVAASRNKRPDMPKDWCPFCKGSGKVPDDYDVLKYDNDFPILSTNPAQPDPFGSDFYKSRESYGKCDVILYSPDHNASLWELPVTHLTKLVRLWQKRYIELKSDEKIKYIFPFENRGKEVGVTMPHPHGQIYGYSFMPLRLRVELENANKYYEKYGENIYSRILYEEVQFEKRVITENNSFIAFIPYFCEYPYGVYILPKRSLSSLEDFADEQIVDFADMLKRITGGFDALFDARFPYMMGIYNAPVNSPEYGDVSEYFTFHVKFFPPLRGANSIKWNASSETAAWAYGNPRRVEDCAVELKAAVEKFMLFNM